MPKHEPEHTSIDIDGAGDVKPTTRKSPLSARATRRATLPAWSARALYLLVLAMLAVLVSSSSPTCDSRQVNDIVCTGFRAR